MENSAKNANNCISSKDFEEIRSIYSASNNIEIFMGSDTDDVIDKLFDTILQRFQEAIGTWNERGSEFIHESVALLYYYFKKIDMKRAASYIATHEWWSVTGATINPKNKKDEKCFQYATLDALDHKNIGKNPQRISKIKPFINKYNWNGIEIPSHEKDWKKFEENNCLKTIAVNILYVPYNTEEICRAYKSNYNNVREN